MGVSWAFAISSLSLKQGVFMCLGPDAVIAAYDAKPEGEARALAILGLAHVIPFPERAERSQLIALLVGAVTLLEEAKGDPIGRAYREALIRRIRNVLARESR
jgi:hypothetical protein